MVDCPLVARTDSDIDLSQNVADSAKKCNGGEPTSAPRSALNTIDYLIDRSATVFKNLSCSLGHVPESSNGWRLSGECDQADVAMQEILRLLLPLSAIETPTPEGECRRRAFWGRPLLTSAGLEF